MPFLPRQERFCRAFVHYGTASTAAQSAGYAPQSANRQGWRLLRAPRIQARIRELQAELAAHQDRADDAIFGKLEVVYRRAL
ncbi:MAG: terminase small subunit, partial [Rhodospirillaceae bacterium]